MPEAPQFISGRTGVGAWLSGAHTPSERAVVKMERDGAETPPVRIVPTKPCPRVGKYPSDQESSTQGH